MCTSFQPPSKPNSEPDEAFGAAPPPSPPEGLPPPPTFDVFAVTAGGAVLFAAALSSKPNSALALATLAFGLGGGATWDLERFGAFGGGVAVAVATVATRVGAGVGTARRAGLRFAWAFAFGASASGFGSAVAINGGGGRAPVTMHVAAPTPLRQSPIAAAAGPKRPPPVDAA